MTTSVQPYTFTIAAGSTYNLPTTGTQFVIRSASGSVDVRLDIGGTMSGLLAGQGYKGARFSSLLFSDTSGGPNTITLQVADDEFIDHRVTGAVTFAPLGATFANSQKTVTNADAQLLAANASRKYLLIQNNSTTGDIYVTLDGSAATAANGVRIAANGGLAEYSTVVPSGAIRAIGTIANNPNIVVVEG